MSMHTPWGRADHQKRFGKSPHCVTFYSTPSHGGFLVTDDMRAKMPAGLQEVGTWAGRNSIGTWYEEDCDWAIVALAFPELFEPEQILAAVETASRSSWDKDPAPTKLQTWLASPESLRVREIAAAYATANAEKFRMGTEWTMEGGWGARARNIAQTVELLIKFPGDTRYKMPYGVFTEADIEKAGGRILERTAS